METVKLLNKVSYYKDSAYLTLYDIENVLTDEFTFDDAIDLISEELSGYDFIETENYNNSKRAIWHNS